ncbi:MAG: hypothetical protein U5R31_03690 [Acidimicrobiia bacterium]|nr:hypothetical protein [Acidimicrobiia bacterium]
MNRVLPELFGRGEEETFDALREEANLAALHDAVDGPVEPACSRRPSGRDPAGVPAPST